METQKIEYVRKNGGVATKIELDDGSIQTVKRSKGQKRGVMFCGIHPDDEKSVIVGFSMCNKMDTFDYVGSERKPGFGLEIAKERAFKWSDHTSYFVQKSWTREQIEDDECPLLYFVNPNLLHEDDDDFDKYNTTELLVEIPPSIVKPLVKFIGRCKKYYKDKDFPEWANNLQLGNRYSRYLPVDSVREIY